MKRNHKHITSLQKMVNKETGNDLEKHQYLSPLHPEWFHVVSSLLANGC